MSPNEFVELFHSVSVKNLKSRFSTGDSTPVVLSDINSKETITINNSNNNNNNNNDDSKKPMMDNNESNNQISNKRSNFKSYNSTDLPESPCESYSKLRKQTTIQDLRVISRIYNNLDSFDDTTSNIIKPIINNEDDKNENYSSEKHIEMIENLDNSIINNNTTCSSQLSTIEMNQNLKTSCISQNSTIFDYLDDDDDDDDEYLTENNKIVDIDENNVIKRLLVKINHLNCYENMIEYGYDDPKFIRDIIDDDDLETLDINNKIDFYNSAKDMLISPLSLSIDNIENIDDLMDFIGLSNYKENFEPFNFDTIYDDENEQDLVDAFEDLPTGYWKRILFFLNIIINNRKQKKQKPQINEELMFGGINTVKTINTSINFDNSVQNKNIEQKQSIKMNIHDSSSVCASISSHSSDELLNDQKLCSIKVTGTIKLNSFNKKTLENLKSLDTGQIKRDSKAKDPNDNEESLGKRTKSYVLKGMKLFTKEKWKKNNSEFLINSADFLNVRSTYYKVYYIGMHPVNHIETKSRKIISQAFEKFRGCAKNIEILPKVGMTVDSVKISIVNHKTKSNVFDNYLIDVLTFTQDNIDYNLFAYTSYIKSNDHIKYIAHIFRSSKPKLVDKLCKVLFERFNYI